MIYSMVLSTRGIISKTLQPVAVFHHRFTCTIGNYGQRRFYLFFIISYRLFCKFNQDEIYAPHHIVCLYRFLAS